MSDLMARWERIKGLHDNLGSAQRVNSSQKAVLLEQNRDQGLILKEIIEKSKNYSTNEPKKYYAEQLKEQKKRMTNILNLPGLQ